MSAPSPPQKRELKPTIYVGTFIHCTTRESLSYHHETALGVSADGIITFMTPVIAATSSISDIASSNGWEEGTYNVIHAPKTTKSGKKVTSFFFPGMLDTHTHAPQYPNTGIFGSSTLLDWLNTYTFPLESSFRSLARARAVYTRVVARSLSHGTTASSYYATTHVEATNLLADICLARGQRALIGRVCMDRFSPADYRDESPESAVEDTKKTMDHCAAIDPSGHIVRPVITPRFAPSCTDACLSALGALHKATGAAIQTHISENHNEIALVEALFPTAPNYAAVYDNAGLLTPGTILAHAVHLSPDELTLVSSRKAKISHCPSSNSSLTSGACRVRALWDAGIEVGLGTDMSGGYSPSILEMTRQALLVSRHVAMSVDDLAEKERCKLSVEEALWLATRGGASCMGLEGKVGGFEIGWEWDAQLVMLAEADAGESESEASANPASPSANTAETNSATKALEDRATDFDPSDGPTDLFGWESWPDRVAKWVYTSDDRNVGAVWVGGRLVHLRRGVEL